VRDQTLRLAAIHSFRICTPAVKDTLRFLAQRARPRA